MQLTLLQNVDTGRLVQVKEHFLGQHHHWPGQLRTNTSFHSTWHQPKQHKIFFSFWCNTEVKQPVSVQETRELSSSFVLQDLQTFSNPYSVTATKSKSLLLTDKTRVKTAAIPSGKYLSSPLKVTFQSAKALCSILKLILNCSYTCAH